MQIVSNGDNLHEMSNSVFCVNLKYVINLSSAEFSQSGKGYSIWEQADVTTIFHMKLKNVYLNIQRESSRNGHIFQALNSYLLSSDF